MLMNGVGSQALWDTYEELDLPMGGLLDERLVVDA